MLHSSTMLLFNLIFFTPSPSFAIPTIDTGLSPHFVGPETKITDFATLTNNNLGNLPNNFTICSSVSTLAFKSHLSPFLLLHNNSQPWVVITIWGAERKSTHHKIDIQVSSFKAALFLDTGVSSNYPGTCISPSVTLSDFHSVSVSETSQSVKTTLWWLTW